MPLVKNLQLYIIGGCLAVATILQGYKLYSGAGKETETPQNKTKLVANIYDIESRQHIKSLEATHVNVLSHNRIHVYDGTELIGRFSNSIVFLK